MVQFQQKGSPSPLARKETVRSLCWCRRVLRARGYVGLIGRRRWPVEILKAHRAGSCRVATRAERSGLLPLQLVQQTLAPLPLSPLRHRFPAGTNAVVGMCRALKMAFVFEVQAWQHPCIKATAMCNTNRALHMTLSVAAHVRGTLNVHSGLQKPCTGDMMQASPVRVLYSWLDEHALSMFMSAFLRGG